MPPKAAALAPPERIVVFLRPNSCAVSVGTTFETFFGLAPSGAIPPSQRPSPDTPSTGRNVPWRAGSNSGPS